MNSPRLLLALTFVAAAAVAGAASASLLRSDRATACTTREGDVRGYVKSARHACGLTVLVGLKLFRTETVQTGNPGQLTFHTDHIDKCIEFADTLGSADVLLPSANIALRHLRGKTWCRRLPGDSGRFVTAPGAVFTLSGTTFGIDSTKAGSLVKLFEGKIVALSTATKQRVVVDRGTQVFLPVAGPPQPPKPLAPDAEDQQAVVFLQLGITPLGPAQVSEHLKDQGESTAVLVGENTRAIQLEAKLLPGVKILAATAAQFQAKPQLAVGFAQKLKARTIVAVGSFAAMERVLEKLRIAVPSEFPAALLFVNMNS